MPAGNVFDLAIGLQAAKGTPLTTAQHRLYLTGGNLGPVRDHADLEETSSSRLRSEGFIQQARVEGAPVAYARPNFLGLLLYGAMGAKAVTGASDPYSHTFTLAPVQPWLTVWRNAFGILFEKFPDTKVSRLVLHSEARAALTVECGFMGLSGLSQAAAIAAPAVETSPTFMHSDGKGIFLVEGSPVSTIESITITLELGLALQQGDSVTPNDATEGQIAVTIETVQVISNAADWNRLHYGSATPAANAPFTPNPIELAGTGIDFGWAKRQADGIALATPERSLHVQATRLQIRSIAGFDPNTSGDPIKQTATYRVYQPAGGVSGLTAVLKNSVTSYAAGT